MSHKRLQKKLNAKGSSQISKITSSELQEQIKQPEQLENPIENKRKSTWQRRRDAKRQIDLLLMKRIDEEFIRDQQYKYGLSVGEIIQKGALQQFECKERSSNGKAQGTQLTMYSVDLGRRVCKCLKELFGYQGRPTVKSINGIRVSYYPCFRQKIQVKQNLD